MLNGLHTRKILLRLPPVFKLKKKSNLHMLPVSAIRSSFRAALCVFVCTQKININYRQQIWTHEINTCKHWMGVSKSVGDDEDEGGAAIWKLMCCCAGLEACVGCNAPPHTWTNVDVLMVLSVRNSN